MKVINELDTRDWEVKFMLAKGFLAKTAISNLAHPCETEAEYDEMLRTNGILVSIRMAMEKLEETEVLCGEDINTYL